MKVAARQCFTHPALRWFSKRNIHTKVVRLNQKKTVVLTYSPPHANDKHSGRPTNWNVSNAHIPYLLH